MLKIVIDKDHDSSTIVYELEYASQPHSALINASRFLFIFYFSFKLIIITPYTQFVDATGWASGKRLRLRITRSLADLKEWFRESTNLVLNLEEKSILFSWQDKNQVMNFIYVTAKYYINANKLSGKALNLDVYEGPAKSFVTGFVLLQCYVLSNIFITNLQSIPPLLKHIFVTFLPSREKQINSLLLVSVRDTDK